MATPARCGCGTNHAIQGLAGRFRQAGDRGAATAAVSVRSGSTASAPASRRSAAVARPLATASDRGPRRSWPRPRPGASPPTYTVMSSPKVSLCFSDGPLPGHPEQRALGVALVAVAADVEVDVAVQAERAQFQHRVRPAAAGQHGLHDHVRPGRPAWPRPPARRPRRAAAWPSRARSSRRAREGGGQFGAERLEQALGLAAGVQVGGVQRERVEEDLRLRPARGLRQLDQRPPGDGRERLGVRRPGHPADIDQGQVDVPQNQPVNDGLRGAKTPEKQYRAGESTAVGRRASLSPCAGSGSRTGGTNISLIARGADPADQVEHRAGLVVGAAGPGRRRTAAGRPPRRSACR